MHFVIRRYEQQDIPDMVKLIREALLVTQFKDISFSKEKMTNLLQNSVNKKSFFAALALDENGDMIGGICADVSEFIFSYEAVAIDFFFYILPHRRGLRIATGLVKEYIEWAKSRKVKRVQLSNSMGVEIEGFAKLATKLGFEQVGTIHQMRI